MDLTSRTGRILLAVAVVLPLIVLGFVAAQKARIYARGVEVRFPIDGYDPRDLVAGHYLIYRVDYGVEDLCASDTTPSRYEAAPGDPVCLCLTDIESVPPVSYEYACEEKATSECRVILKGGCKNGRFTAGLERFYINEGKAAELDRIVRQGKSRIVVKIDRSGEALVHSLETP